MPTVFISYSYRDYFTVKTVLDRLPKKISLWIDQHNIAAGESLNEKIERVIRHKADLFLLFLSRDAANSEWVKKELTWALNREKEVGYTIVIPLLIMDITDETYAVFKALGLDLYDRKYIAFQDFSNEGLDSFAKKLSDRMFDWLVEEYDEHKKHAQDDELTKTLHQNIKPTVPKEESFFRSNPDLWVRISNKDCWEKLEDIAIKATIDGGIAAMGFYREARAKRQVLSVANESNPSTLADLQGTISILRTLDSQLAPLCEELECKLAYLGEETVYKERIHDEIKQGLHGEILSGEDFFDKPYNHIRVIIDAIDGTSNFDRGLPLFCSSLAIFVDDQLRVSAIYDPIHHIVFSALLPGAYTDPTRNSTARTWYISGGYDKNLKPAVTGELGALNLRREAIGIHLPRNDKIKRDDLIGSKSDSESILQKLANEFGGVYVLNSGLLALAEVARGGLSGFVNITTNPWDTAAGEVLINACGGKVTDFVGKEINYKSSEKISVVAAKDSSLHTEIMRIIRNT